MFCLMLCELMRDRAHHPVGMCALSPKVMHHPTLVDCQRKNQKQTRGCARIDHNFEYLHDVILAVRLSLFMPVSAGSSAAQRHASPEATRGAPSAYAVGVTRVSHTVEALVRPHWLCLSRPTKSPTIRKIAPISNPNIVKTTVAMPPAPAVANAFTGSATGSV